MKLSVLNTSVVVLAEAHNPSILHPAFLVAQRIVPPDWELAEAPVCTPAISLAKYRNGVVFTAEVEKFQVLQNAPSLSSPIPDLVARYLDALPHVHYTAVGINVAGCVECPEAPQWILERFVRQGAWNDATLRPKAVGVKFIYPAEGAVLNLSCDAALIGQGSENCRVPVVLVGANYHTGVSREHALAEVKQAISKYRERVEYFSKIAQIVLGLEA